MALETIEKRLLDGTGDDRIIICNAQQIKSAAVCRGNARPAFEAVLFEDTASGVRTVGTDAYRLAVIDCDGTGYGVYGCNKNRVMLKIDSLVKAIKTKHGTCAIDLNAGKAYLISKTGTIKPKGLLDATDTKVWETVADDVAFVSEYDQSPFPNYKSLIDVEHEDGFCGALNPAYLADAHKIAKDLLGKLVPFKFSQSGAGVPNKPCFMEAQSFDNDIHVTYLAMPVRV